MLLHPWQFHLQHPLESLLVDPDPFRDLLANRMCLQKTNFRQSLQFVASHINHSWSMARYFYLLLILKSSVSKTASRYLINGSFGMEPSFQFCIYDLYSISSKLLKVLVTIFHFKQFQTIFFLKSFNRATYHNIWFVIFEPPEKAVARHSCWTVFVFQGIPFILKFSILPEKILLSSKLQDLHRMEFYHFLYQKYNQSPKNPNRIELASCRISFKLLKLSPDYAKSYPVLKRKTKDFVSLNLLHNIWKTPVTSLTMLISLYWPWIPIQIVTSHSLWVREQILIRPNEFNNSGDCSSHCHWIDTIRITWKWHFFKYHLYYYWVPNKSPTFCCLLIFNFFFLPTPPPQCLWANGPPLSPFQAVNLLFQIFF